MKSNRLSKLEAMLQLLDKISKETNSPEPDNYLSPLFQELSEPLIKSDFQKIKLVMEFKEEIEKLGETFSKQSITRLLTLTNCTDFSNIHLALKKYSPGLIQWGFSFDQILELTNTDNAVKKLEKLWMDCGSLRKSRLSNQQILAIISSKNGLEKISILFCNRFMISTKNLNVQSITDMLIKENGMEEFSALIKRIESSQKQKQPGSQPAINQNSAKSFVTARPLADLTVPGNRSRQNWPLASKDGVREVQGCTVEPILTTSIPWQKPLQSKRLQFFKNKNKRKETEEQEKKETENIKKKKGNYSPLIV